MPSLPFRLTIVAALTVGASATAMAQSWYPNNTTVQPRYGTPSDISPQDRSGYDYQQQTYQSQQQTYQDQKQNYRDQQQHYRDQRSAYEARKQGWRDRRDAYDVQRNNYDVDRYAYQRQRAAYDAQYGPGAWERRYGYPRYYDYDDDR